MAIISDLPLGLLEEVLTRVPLTSLRAVRFTCKKWNEISNNRSFTEKRIVEAKKKQLEEEFEVIMMDDFMVHLMSVNLHDNVNPLIKHKGKLISLNDQIDIHSVFHCDGLLLCISRDKNFKLMVWNPNFGQTRWIKPKKYFHRSDNYALGYAKKQSHRSYKIFRYVDCYAYDAKVRTFEFEVYSFKSNSWKVVLDVRPDWKIEFAHRGLSLKGNTYWYAMQKLFREGEDGNDFLICFDFTRERFGPRLPLPFHVSARTGDAVILSSVGQDQLAVLFQDSRTLWMEIWVTSKIEPNEVSWNKLFLGVNMRPLTGLEFLPEAASFFIDQKKNLVVVFGVSTTRAKAYIIGKEGYMKTVYLGESADEFWYPVVYSYVPSSVQIKQLT